MLSIAVENRPVGNIIIDYSTSAQNVCNKFSRDNYKVREMQEIADALGYELSIKFIDKETSEEV